MDKQTEAMIIMAKGDGYITAGQIRDTGKWHGLLYVNHPTPSGSERYLLAQSTSEEFDTSEDAVKNMEKAQKQCGRKWEVVS